MDLATYLSTEYSNRTRRAAELSLHLRQVANLFLTVYARKPKECVGFPYSWEFGKTDATKFWSEGISFSTQGMCCAGIDAILAEENRHSFLLAEVSKKLRIISEELRHQLFAALNVNLAAGEKAWESGTWGIEDIFTAFWLTPLVISDDECPEVVRNKVVSILAAVASKDHFNKPLFDVAHNEAGPHPSPLTPPLPLTPPMGR